MISLVYYLMMVVATDISRSYVALEGSVPRVKKKKINLPFRVQR